MREEQEKERQRKAEGNFKEWLAKNNDKGKANPKPPHYSSECDLAIISCSVAFWIIRFTVFQQ